MYVTATAAGERLLAGPARLAAGVAFVAVLVVLAFSGAFLVVPAGVAAAVLPPYLWSAITPASRSTAVSSSCSPR